MFIHRLGFSGLYAVGLSLRLKRSIDVVPRSSVILLVPSAYIIGPPRCLHKQHKAVLGDRNVLKPRLPLDRVPGMLLQHCFHFLDGCWVLLLKDSVGADPRQHVAGDVPGRSGKRQYGKREKYKGCD